MKKGMITLLFVFSCRSIFAYEPLWIETHIPIALQTILEAMSVLGAKTGAIQASPQRVDPDYGYHWLRDAALVADSLLTYYETQATPEQKLVIRIKLFEWYHFTYEMIETLAKDTHPHLTGQSEAKVNLDGTVYIGPWGRPQDDGPGSTASALIHFAKVFAKEEALSALRSELYKINNSDFSPIKVELEHTSRIWRRMSFDIWEEVLGDHFYNRMVQRRALLEGADYADTVGDANAAKLYREQAHDIEATLSQFFSDGGFVPTLHPQTGANKSSGLDIAVVLGLLHGLRAGEKIQLPLPDGQIEILSMSSPRVVKYVERLINVFKELYPINQRPGVPGVAIGRYPEDKFYGGNPWVLATLAVAEWYYRRAYESPTENIQPWLDLANQFIERVRYHKNADGSTHEQIHRVTGYGTSAAKLTWNCAAFLTTNTARLRLQL